MLNCEYLIKSLQPLKAEFFKKRQDNNINLECLERYIKENPFSDFEQIRKGFGGGITSIQFLLKNLVNSGRIQFRKDLKTVEVNYANKAPEKRSVLVKVYFQSDIGYP